MFSLILLCFRAKQIYTIQKDMKSLKCLFSCLQTVFFINGVSGMLFGRELNLVGNPFILYLQYLFLLISRHPVDCRATSGI